MSAPHMSRESTVKLLEALKSAKNKRVADLRNAEIATALTEVVAKVRRAAHMRSRRAVAGSCSYCTHVGKLFGVCLVCVTL